MPVQISIDGALPYETSTLVDDMPLISSSSAGGPAGHGTDLGLYPLNGFGAADVIRGPGANAPSIVDSIGGSFVLHAPGIVSKNHYDLSLSTDPYGGIVANAQAAIRWKKLSATVTYGVNDSPGPITTPGIQGFPYFSPSEIDGKPFSQYIPPCSPPSCLYGGSLYNPNYVNGFYGTQSGFLMCCFDISSPWIQHSGSLSLNYALSPSMNAELFYAGEISQGPSAYYNCTDNFVPPTGYTGKIPAGQNIFNGSFYNAPGYSNQAASLLEEKVTAQFGRGLISLAALQNRTFSSYALSTSTSATVQLFGGGTLNGMPTIFNGGTYNVTFPCSVDSNYFSGSNNRDLLLSYTTLLGSDVHGGASYVQSYYNIPAQTLYSIPGVYSFSSSTPSAISQTTNELRVFFGGNPSEKTALDFSMYFTNANYHIPNPNVPSKNIYTDARYSYAAPRLGFIWRPTASVAIRAAAGGGFAEAPLSDLVGSNGACTISATTCNITLKNLNLQPEKSSAFDVGTDVRLRHDTILSFDLYRANLFGQIYNSTTFTGVGTCPGNLTAQCYVTQYGNLGHSRFEGILLDVRHNVPRGLYWSLSGGLTRGYLVSVPAAFYSSVGGTCNPSTGTNCQNLTVVPNVNFNGQFAASIPYAQGLGTLGYRWNGDKYINLVATYYGNNNTYFRPAFVEWDGHVYFPLTKHTSLLATFRNITGIYDNTVQMFSPSSLSGAPTISGLPYPLYGEEYGPRTVILTMNVAL